MKLLDIRFVIRQRWQTKMTKSIAPSQAGMSAITKEIRNNTEVYGGLTALRETTPRAPVC